MRAARATGAVRALLLPPMDDEERKCSFGACDARPIERLRKECLRDGGRP
jgi:hypothetical protein